MSGLIYLDYLDRHIGYSHTAADLNATLNVLKLDLLTHPMQVLAVAAPAIAKSKTTFDVVETIRASSRAKDFKLFLSPKSRGSLLQYTRSRMTELENSLPEEMLDKSLEYVGYNSDYWRRFGSNSMLTPHNPLYFDRPQSADGQFRKAVVKRIDSDRTLEKIHEQNFGRIVIDEITKRASDTSSLFQRELILKQIKDEIPIGFGSTAYLEEVFDLSFDEANSDSVGGQKRLDASVNSREVRRIIAHVPGAFEHTLFADFVSRPLSFSSDVSTTYEWREFLHHVSGIATLIDMASLSSLKLQIAIRKTFRWTGRALRSILIAGVCALIFDIPAFSEVLEFLSVGLLSFALDDIIPRTVRRGLVQAHGDLLLKMKRLALLQPRSTLSISK